MAIPTRPAKCRRKFRKVFPGGFQDETYLDWERDYKWANHKRWVAALSQSEFGRLLRAGEYAEIAARAIRVEQQFRHSMVFSFEKMASRDAVKSSDGAGRFARGLFDYLHGTGSAEDRLRAWVEVVCLAASQADESSDLAAGHSVRIHRKAARSHIAEADRHAYSG